MAENGGVDFAGVDAGQHDVRGGESAPIAIPEWIGRYRVERVLGKGGFGLVFLARDEQLHRSVAVKVPHARLISRPEDAEAYLLEARTVANLDHPNIVAVYDVGRTVEFPCYIVSRFIDGLDLSAALKQSRPSTREAAELVATIADALHYAHQRGLVHRDVKPGNILIEKNGKPFVADFGLALREKDLGKGPRHAGTPAYMSPEQARGEGHRVDGRSDVFSLGVVLYELLAGRRPFYAESRQELLAQITTFDPKPPRQISDAIPKELERICLRALAKRAADRYTTAGDFSDDLWHFLNDAPPEIRAAAIGFPSTELAQGQDEPSLEVTRQTTIPSASQPLKIVPKGLRSFDEHDADFFLELLPGPRDRAGLPDSIRFWKTRIEDSNSAGAFTVGLIYGPSGCGKSSLVKAGLVPRLSDRIITIFVEATPDQTELRLLNGLRRRCPALLEGLSLKELLAALRREHAVPNGKKVLIVIDQFEQWLHASQEERGTELVHALRQCDGDHVQCLVLVRDDFYVAVNRFFQQIEVPILEGHNYALVDLFDLDHARRVLTAFGRAYGKLPESPAAVPVEQQTFLRQAVAGLAQDGKVISVRLALFAEMMKGRTWTAESLRDVGGTEGVGITFLEETFSANTAPPTHRLHQFAARAVLAALLPDAGTDIKGQMQPFEKLLEASGYVNCPDQFRALLAILENEVRLIAPTEPEGLTSGSERAETSASAQHYQLTHDFLVPALREWLTRKRRETRQGRAELLLVERTALWIGKPERKQLPSWREWLGIRISTREANWTEPQRKMMRVANRHHLSRMTLTVVLLLTMVCAAIAAQHITARQARFNDAQNLVQNLWSIEMHQLPKLLDELDKQPDFWRPDVARIANDPSQSPDRRTRAGLALARSDSAGLDYLLARLLEANAADHRMIRNELRRWKELLAAALWSDALDLKTPPDRLLRITTALADYDPDEANWKTVAVRVVKTLVDMDPLLVNPWIDEFNPVREYLRQPLAQVFSDALASNSQRLLAASVIVQYAMAEERFLPPELLSQLVIDADPAQFAVLVPLMRIRRSGLVDRLTAALEAGVPLRGDQTERQIQRQANAAEALLQLDQGERFWPRLKQSPDPRLRTELIDRLHSAKLGWPAALERLSIESEGTIRQAIVLGLDDYRAGLSTDEQSQIADRLGALYESDSDAGVHSAAEWVLSRWGFADQIVDGKRRLAGRPPGDRGWFINSQMQTMLVIPAPGAFQIGSADDEPGRDQSEAVRQVSIERTFAISAHEVTADEIRKSRGQLPPDGQPGSTDDRPATFVSWFDAVKYCRWLSEQDEEAIDESERCYPPRELIGPAMRLAPDYMQREGYRLPAEHEWEFAARAGASTRFFFGESERPLAKYAWYSANSAEHIWPVGRLRPSPFGLFDVCGNASEWCDVSGPGVDFSHRVIRGGSYRATSRFLRSAMREQASPESSLSLFGFRIVKTMRLPDRRETSARQDQ